MEKTTEVAGGILAVIGSVLIANGFFGSGALFCTFAVGAWIKGSVMDEEKAAAKKSGR